MSVVVASLFACLASRSAPPKAVAIDGCPPFGVEGQYDLVDYPGKDAPGLIPLSKEYTFAGGRYTMEGYPALTITGAYAVVAVEGARVQLRLTDTIFDGHPREDSEVWLTFSECGAVMEMEGMTYRRRATE